MSYSEEKGDPSLKITTLRKLNDRKKTWNPWCQTNGKDTGKTIIQFDIGSDIHKKIPAKGRRNTNCNELQFVLLHNSGTTCFMNALMQILVRTQMFKDLSDKFNQNTSKHFLRMMFAIERKIVKQTNVIQSLVPELEALATENDDMLDFDQQQDASEMCIFILNKIHTCVMTKSVAIDGLRFKTKNETMETFVNRRINGYWQKIEKSLMSDHCSIYMTTTDTCAFCVNCNNNCQCVQNSVELTMETYLNLPMTSTQSVPYVFLRVDGTETDNIGAFDIIDTEIIYDNNWHKLLKLLIEDKHSKAKINIEDDKITIDGVKFVYYIANGIRDVGGNVVASIIQSSRYKPTIQQIITSNRKVIVIQQRAPNAKFSVPLSISSLTPAHKYRFPMIIPFMMFFEEGCNLQNVIQQIFQHIKTKCLLPYETASNSPWYKASYCNIRNSASIDDWICFMGTNKNVSKEHEVLLQLQTTPNMIVGIECGFKYHWQPSIKTWNFADILKKYFESETVSRYCPCSGKYNQLWTRAWTIMSPLSTTLIMFLKRYTVDPITGIAIKNNDIVLLTAMELVLPTSDDVNNIYKITGTMGHSGSLTAGHYVSYLPMINQSAFVELNDDKFKLNQNLQNASTNLSILFMQQTRNAN